MYKHEESGRGPLLEEWGTKEKEMMTSYKLLRINSGIKLIGGKVDAYLLGIFSELFKSFHRQLFCWMDEWYGCDEAALFELEERIQAECDKLREDETAKVDGYGAALVGGNDADDGAGDGK